MKCKRRGCIGRISEINIITGKLECSVCFYPEDLEPLLEEKEASREDK